MHAPLDPASIRPLKRAEYDKLVRDGVFADERVELLYGMVVRMSPIGPGHGNAVTRLTELLVLALHGRARIRPQIPLAASDESEPEPDLSVVAPKDYLDDHPANAWLVVEVSDSSLAHDRKVKAGLYAESGVPEYWIVNLIDRAIEVHRDPVKGSYTTKTAHARGDAITLLHFPDVTIRVSDVIR
jgi:Uma2 family endonuclease